MVTSRPTDSPIVSVVMPVYNSIRYLAECIESLLGQTFTAFEVLAFDDGSSDGSLELLREYAARDDRLKVFERNHCGYTPHLNAGIRIANGEFLARMDSDDVCVGHRFETQVAYLKENSAIVAVGAWYDFIDSSGRAFATYCTPEAHADIDQLHLRGLGGTIGHPTLMARTSAMRAVGGYRPDFEPAEDLDLFLRLGELGELANVPERLLAYRVHDAATSSQRRAKQLDANRRILGEAWVRRGLPGEPPPQDHAVRKSETTVELLDERFNRSMQAGFFGTARDYGVKRCLRRPWSLRNWVDLGRACYAPWHHPTSHSCVMPARGPL